MNYLQGLPVNNQILFPSTPSPSLPLPPPHSPGVPPHWASFPFPGQYLVRKEFDAWMATLPPPTTTLRAMVDFAGLTTVEDLLALWTELASAGDVGPLHAAAMSYVHACPCAVHDSHLVRCETCAVSLDCVCWFAVQWRCRL